jgi:hypothetical protein
MTRSSLGHRQPTGAPPVPATSRLGALVVIQLEALAATLQEADASGDELRHADALRYGREPGSGHEVDRSRTRAGALGRVPAEQTERGAHRLASTSFTGRSTTGGRVLHALPRTREETHHGQP